MFIYKDVKGKTLSQAQVDLLDKQFHGFLSMEIVEEGPPTIVQVTPPNSAEIKAIQKLRDEETAALKKKWIGKTLPAFSLKTLDSKTLTPKSLMGHATVLFFWSKSDYGSLNQLSAMNQLAQKYKGKPVQFWALTFEDPVLIKEFLKKRPLAFIHAPGDFSFVMEKMGIMQTPVSMMLDSKGVIRFLSTSTQKNIDELLSTEIAKMK